MNIQEEYERLVKMSEDESGWKKIDEAWNLACNSRKDSDGEWLTSESKGPLVEGFAIDSKTKKIICGTTHDHSWAYFQLYEYLQESENYPSCDEIEMRIVKGWRGKILDFQEPCVFMASMRFFEDPDFLKEIEESILVQGIGLPLSGLFLQQLRQ